MARLLDAQNVTKWSPLSFLSLFRPCFPAMPLSPCCLSPALAFQSPITNSISCLGIASKAFGYWSQRVSFASTSSPSLVGAQTRTIVVFMFLESNLAEMIRSLTGVQLSRHSLAYLVIMIASPLWGTVIFPTWAKDGLSGGSSEPAEPNPPALTNSQDTDPIYILLKLHVLPFQYPILYIILGLASDTLSLRASLQSSSVSIILPSSHVIKLSSGLSASRGTWPSKVFSQQISDFRNQGFCTVHV